MSAKRKPDRTSDADPDAERIKDPEAGLERMKETLRRILKVPKSKIRRDLVPRRGPGP